MRRTEIEIEFDQRMGARIRCFREQCGLSEQQFAERLGSPTTPQTIQDYELGILSLPVCHLMRLSDTLEVTPYFLLYDPPFVNAADWQFFSNFLKLNGRGQHDMRQSMKRLVEDDNAE